MKLKDLIRAVRSSKTAADERAIIAKESAHLRTAIKDDSSDKYSNVAKLLYIHLLGYPAHFGQIECLKLVASPKYADKRLGYLGIMVLLDESQEVLTLVTNSLKNDMNHSNMYIVGLALCTLANISSAEMAQDLCSEVERLLGTSNTYIRKKAALCAVRIIRKVPDLHENFISRCRSLLNERSHGILLTGVTLIHELCILSPEALNEYRRMVPTLVKHLKSLLSAGFSPEHDVSGITDPFLQVKILNLLKLLGHNDSDASEAMNDVLAQVATNTDSSKNVGNSILYETVLTILNIKSDNGLKVMAINILGKFLSNKDNNIRYVALNTLLKCIDVDNNAVQRHRNIIIDCLQDPDISIRRRALELSFALINESTVRILVKELLSFLEVADSEFYPSMTTRICYAADRYSPNKKWYVDTVLCVLKLAGNYAKDDIIASFIKIIANNPEIQHYTASKLYFFLKGDEGHPQEGLIQAASWIIGEFGELLTKPGLYDGENLAAVSELDMINLFTKIIQGPFSNNITKGYVINALMKLSRFGSHSEYKLSNNLHKIKHILAKYTTSFDLELQQRAVEYISFFKYNDLRLAVLERMPVPEITELKSPLKSAPQSPTKSGKEALESVTKKSDPLVDIFGDLNVVEAHSNAGNGKVAFDKNGLRITLLLLEGGANSSIQATFENFSSFPISDFLFQCAVPKALKLAMLPPSSTSIAVNSTATQMLQATNPTNAVLKLRMKISYTQNGNSVSEMADFAGF